MTFSEIFCLQEIIVSKSCFFLYPFGGCWQMLLYRSLCRSWFMVYRDVSRWLLWGYLKGIVVFCEDCVCLLQCVCFCINDSASPQTISPMKSHELKLNLSDLVKKNVVLTPLVPYWRSWPVLLVHVRTWKTCWTVVSADRCSKRRSERMGAMRTRRSGGRGKKAGCARENGKDVRWENRARGGGD